MTISFSDFQKLDIRIAKIEHAERVEGSDKLIKLLVDLGEEKRQIIAGISKKYAPDFLVGQQIVIIVNLEPRQLMGLESQGMLLAASGDDGPVLLMPCEGVNPGAKVG